MRALIFILIAAVCFTGCTAGAGNGQTSSDATSSDVSSKLASAPSTEQGKTIDIGAVMGKDEFECILNAVDFSYDVLPEHKEGLYTHYAADEGKIYIEIGISVKNLQKTAVSCDDIMGVEADYNGGYTYKAFPAVEDSKLGFSYANITNIDPLETLKIKYLIDCPIEVGKNSVPLSLTFTLGSEKYVYVVRGEDGAGLRAQDRELNSSSDAPTASSQPSSEASSSKVDAPPKQASSVEQKVADYSKWVPYSNGSADDLARLISKGWVVYYGGQYLASPEYFAMAENQEIVYFNDISGDETEVINRFTTQNIRIDQETGEPYFDDTQ